MVAKGDGLRPLEVGISGHDGSFVDFRLLGDGLHQLGHQLGDLVDLGAQIHADVQRHLIVS